MSHKTKSILLATLLITLLTSSVTYATLAPLTPPPPGGYNSGSNSILDPGCAPNTTDCWVNLPTGGSVTANNGLTATGTNVQLGGVLVQNTSIDQDGNDLNITNGNFSFISGYDGLLGTQGFVQKYTKGNRLQLIGLANDGSSSSIILGDILDITEKDSLAALISITEMNRITLHAGNLNATNGPSSDIEIQDSGVGIRYNNGATTGQSSYFNLDENGQLFESQDSNTSNSSGFMNRANIGVTFYSNGSEYTFPRADGTANQVLTTDGSGQLSWQNAGGGSGWSLTGNSGTTAGTNFIGTTDAQDFMVKTNGNQIALFGQNGNVAIGNGSNASLNNNIAIGTNALATGIGSLSIATAFDDIPSTLASGDGSTSIGYNGSALGKLSVVLGSGIASGDASISLGNNSNAFSGFETVMGFSTSTYSPLDMNDFNKFDRLFSIGNGQDFGLGFTPHNAYTLWKDGSFAYNDDNFQNDNPGIEQNMFYFNYGNHDGAGSAQTKRAIRLGSVTNDEWDITSANVGDRSIALGFGEGIASGENTFAFGNAIAEGDNSVAFNQGYAQGQQSFAWGKNAVASDSSFAFSTGNYATASGNESWALGSGVNASGDYSKSFGLSTSANSFAETVLGLYNTNYVANDPAFSDSADRLFNIGNGTGFGSESDALTILKNGQTGIAIDNFEANTNGNIFQVGDGTTGIIGYVDNGTGNWVAVSDERKKDNITDITYGLNELIQLRPTSFNYKRNNEHTIGFLAQQVLPIIPEAVYGTESEGYGMSYATLTPVIVKAIQELNLKVDLLSMNTGNTSTSVFDGLKGWLADTANGIQKIFVHEVQTDKLCVGNTCVNEQQLQQLLQNQSIPSTSPNPDPTPSDPVTTPSDENPPVVTPDPGNGDNTSTPSDPGMSPVTDTPASE